MTRLAHPNIIDIHDFGVEDGTTYSVTELLEGESLAERLEAGPLSWRRATEIGAAITAVIAGALIGAIYRRPQQVHEA